MKRVYETNQLWYRRTFKIPRGWKDKNVLLHFGAVDWQTKVFVNGQEVGAHTGGYDGFSFEITGALKPSGEQEIVVSVFDPTDAGYQPRGKQIRNPHGIWYTPTSGIWQTVWLEPVSPAYLQNLKLTPSLDDSSVTVQAQGIGGNGKTSVKVTGTAVDDTTRAIATLQQHRKGVGVAAAVPNATTDTITIYLTAPAPSATKVTWMLLD